MTPSELAAELGISVKTIRVWLRRAFPRDPSLKGTDWELAERHVSSAREHWGSEWKRSAWLFQANPSIYDLEEELESRKVGDESTWTVSRHKQEMRAGDHAIFWQAGKRAGVLALGELTDDAKPRKKSSRYTQSANEWEVKYVYTNILETPITRTSLLSHPVLKNLLVLKAPQATNFHVQPNEWEALTGLISSGMTELSRWDAFVHWARRLFESGDFDARERNYKLEIAQKVEAARNSLASTDQWWESLRKAFGPPNNLTPWQLHDKYLKWAKENFEEARSGLDAAWNESSPIEGRVGTFLAHLPRSVTGGSGLRLAVASFLQAGVDVFHFPIYRPTPVNKALQLAGEQPPPRGSTAEEIYVHFLDFLDKFMEEALKRDFQMRDRLDAQSLAWALSSSEPPDQWSSEEKNMFRQFQGKGLSTPLDLGSVVERFKDEEGYPTERDLKKQGERVELAAAITEDALKEPDISTIRRLGGPAYGSPGPQSAFMSLMGSEDGPLKVALALSHLLYGQGEIEERFDEVLEGSLSLPGMKEALLTKALAVTYPDQWLPTYVTHGPKGKRAMLFKLGLDPAHGTRAESAVRTNSQLRELLSPYFEDDTWGMMRFLFWLLSESPVKEETLGTLAERLLIDVADLQKIRRLLEDKRQIIFYGPPGTGKTFIARELARFFSQAGGMKKIQFHPSYAYEDFVEGYRPRLIDGHPGFQLVDGPLKVITSAALEDPGDLYVLLIDEINRGNIAKIFGELYYLLEYRDEEIALQYSDIPFALPENLWIISTMNTADRSIALVDAALRRRFYFVPFFPDAPPIQGLLRRWLERHHPSLSWVADAVDSANELLGDRHSAIGPSHFMKTDLSEDWIELIWQHSVLPYIEEQYFGEEDRLKDFALKRLRNGGVEVLQEDATESDG